jgi:hypothetical protein
MNESWTPLSIKPSKKSGATNRSYRINVWPSNVNSLSLKRARRLLDIIGDGKGNAFSMKESDNLAERKEFLAQSLSELDGMAQWCP